MVLDAQTPVHAAQIRIVRLGEDAEWNVHPGAVDVDRVRVHADGGLAFKDGHAIFTAQQVGGREAGHAAADDRDAPTAIWRVVRRGAHQLRVMSSCEAAGRASI